MRTQVSQVGHSYPVDLWGMGVLLYEIAIGSHPFSSNSEVVRALYIHTYIHVYIHIYIHTCLHSFITAFIHAVDSLVVVVVDG